MKQNSDTCATDGHNISINVHFARLASLTEKAPLSIHSNEHDSQYLVSGVESVSKHELLPDHQPQLITQLIEPGGLVQPSSPVDSDMRRGISWLQCICNDNPIEL